MKNALAPRLFALVLFPFLLSQASADQITSSDFTDGSVYSTGSINGQDGWSAQSGGTVVDDGAGNLIGVGVDGFESVVNSGSSAASVVASGEMYTSRVTFSYNDNSGGAGSGPHVGASIYAGSNPADGQVSMILRRTGTDYRFSFATNWGNAFPDFNGDGNGQFNQSGTFTDLAIGIDHASPDTLSDELTLELKITAGATVDDWVALGTLTNETTGLQVFSWTPTLAGDSTFTFDAAAGSTLFGGFGGGQSDNNQNVSDRIISSHEFESTITAVPEPGSALVVIAGLTGMLIRRRRVR